MINNTVTESFFIFRVVLTTELNPALEKQVTKEPLKELEEDESNDGVTTLAKSTERHSTLPIEPRGHYVHRLLNSRNITCDLPEHVADVLAAIDKLAQEESECMKLKSKQ